MTSPARNFLGIPVQGDITPSRRRAVQRPLEEFQPILQAVLDDPTVIEFGWRQYTPYFNDGDPCEFDARGTWIRTDADRDVVDEDDEYQLEVYGHRSLGNRPSTYNRDTETYEYGAYEGPDEGRYDRASALAKAVEGGHFYDVLLAAFGDHAHVTVRRGGIEVEFYEHD